MVMKVLFFDTCAIIKYWVDEPGSDVLRWLCKPDTKMLLGLSFSTSEQVEKEFYSVIDRIAKSHDNPAKYASTIKNRAKPYFKSVFHIRDSKSLPKYKFGRDTDENEIISKYALNPNKESGDAKIISCVINYLRFLGGASLPHVVTSDQKFQNIITGEGYKHIDPEKQTKSEIEEYFLSL